MTDVPAKYQPDDRQFENKQWLYERYWGDLQPMHVLADECNVCHHTIREAMTEHGIPRHPDNWTRENNVSPFAGFYNDENARTEGDYYEDCHPTEPTDYSGDFVFDHWVGVGD